MVNLSDMLAARAQRRRELRAELTELDQGVSTEELQAVAYLEALRRERAHVEADLRRLARQRPDSRAWWPYEKAEGEPPMASERVANAEARLRDIDAEMERVGG